MNVIEQIFAHRSVRNFEPRPVPEAVIDAVVGAASRAPTGGSLQLYTVIVTTEAARRETLAAIHFGVDAIRQAPVVLTFCVDTHRVSRWLELGGETPGFHNAWGLAMGYSDALLSAQNASLAAESLGLGTCFLGSTIAAAPVLCRFLECPGHVMPIATLVLGYPDLEKVPAHGGSRLPVEAVFHRETYKQPSDVELRAHYARHAPATFDMFASVPSVAAAANAFGIQDLGALYARLNYPRDLLELSGAYWGAAVTEQGFSDDAKVARAAAVRAAMSCIPVAALPPIRQLVFALATATGRLDHRLKLAPDALEAELFRFVNARDAKLYADFAEQSLFHPGVRARLDAVLATFGEPLDQAAE
jgi:FMN reductase (NADPH)